MRFDLLAVTFLALWFWRVGTIRSTTRAVLATPTAVSVSFSGVLPFWAFRSPANRGMHAGAKGSALPSPAASIAAVPVALGGVGISLAAIFLALWGRAAWGTAHVRWCLMTLDPQIASGRMLWKLMGSSPLPRAMRQHMLVHCFNTSQKCYVYIIYRLSISWLVKIAGGTENIANSTPKDINPPKMTEHPFVYWGTLKLTPHEFHQLAAAAALSPEAEETAAEPESWTPGFQDCEGQAGAFANLSALRYIEIIIKVYKFYTFYKLYKLHISSISYMSFMSYRSGRHSSLEDFLVVQYHLLRSHHMSPCKNRNRPGTGRRDDPQLMVKYSMRPCACAHRYLRTYLSTISLISLRFFWSFFRGIQLTSSPLSGWVQLVPCWPGNWLLSIQGEGQSSAGVSSIPMKRRCWELWPSS